LKNLGVFAAEVGNPPQDFKEAAPSRLAQIEAKFTEPRFAAVNAAFEVLKKKRGHEVAWHTPLSITSVRALARKIGRLHEYEVFYSQYSESMHGARYKNHFTVGKAAIALPPIRNLDGFSTKFSIVANVVLSAYKQVLATYRPGQLDEFDRKYFTLWRDAFLNAPQVTYS